MATTKITITVPTEQLKAIRAQVKQKTAASVSAYVQNAIEKTLLAEALWKETLDEALAATGGPLTAEEHAWAGSVLNGKVPRHLKYRPKAASKASKERTRTRKAA